MTRSLSQIKEDSRQVLAGNYMLFFVVLVLTGLMTGAANHLLSYLPLPYGRVGFVFLMVLNLILDYLVMILAKMFQAGQYFLSLNIARYNRVSVSDLFLAFRYDTAKAWKISAILALIETLCTAPMTISFSNLLYVGAFRIGKGADVPVFSILLVAGLGILGMILLEVGLAYPFSQALFLYIDHQEYSAAECLANSRSLMRGKIGNYFLLHLTLTGYFVLCILSMGIGLIWVLPYLNVIRSNYYMNLTGAYKPY